MQTVKNIFPQNFRNFYHFFKAVAALIYFRYPARNLKVIAVTGTDGKTTTSTLIHHVLTGAGKRTALISTVAAKIGSKTVDVGLHVTSPDPIKLQKLIREISDKGYEYLVLEVTSHGIDQYRTLGTNISYAVLTNVSHEHLDYHGTFEKYLLTKVRLLNSSRYAFVNKKDVSYKKVIKLINPNVQLVSYDVSSLNTTVKKHIKKRFKENFNRLNSAAAYSVCKNLGIKDSEFLKAVANFPGVVGRMDRVENKKGINIIIDFAHTPNALKNVLTELKDSKKKASKLISVFGCAGERDKSKRKEMGKISAKLADVSVFTAEDPRSEDVSSIIEAIANGAHQTIAIEVKYKPNGKLKKVKKGRHIFIRIPERGEAITYAINSVAKKGDTVVVCGKGHEKSMAYNGVEYPWSDHQAVKVALKGGTKTIER
jgi:UDP-N-acetylmuramoyl-L-alanyl-D-glutamate--2,6-diaminopimelate ligase